MFLSSLSVERFRNLESQTIAFGPGFNLIHGPNGAGKTALLESVHVLSRARSFRTPKYTSLIRTGSDDFLVRATIKEAASERRLALQRQKTGKTALRLNSESQVKVSDLAKHLPVHTILPDASNLVFGGPSIRRVFLDWGVFHVEHLFLEVSRRYRRTLSQRNAWLKQEANERTSIKDDPWLPALLTYGDRLNAMREQYITVYAPIVAQTLSQLSPDLTVTLRYHWGGTQNIEASQQRMAESWARDVKFGTTHRGPHRSEVFMEAAGMPIAETLSRGQAKLVSCAAILAQVVLMNQEAASTSVVLIDDFGAELDDEHWRRFCTVLSTLNCQVIATSAAPLNQQYSWLRELPNYREFHVEQGLIAEV